MNKEQIRYNMIRIIDPFYTRVGRFLNNIKHGNKLRILYFHHIPFPSKQLDNLIKLIDFISAYFGFIAPEDIKLFLKKHGFEESTKFLLTFDDGYASDVKVAMEILNPRGIKAIFFVCPGFIECEKSSLKEFISRNFYTGRIKPSDVPGNMAPLRWDDINKLISTGHTIGAHTLNHARLSRLSDEFASEREIIGSGDLLENKLDINVEWFAYPFGSNESIDGRAYKAIRKRYKYCCTGLRGFNTDETDFYYLYRDNINLSAPLYYTEFILKGGFDFVYFAKMKKLKNMIGAL